MISLWVITGISVYRGTYETLAFVWLGKLLVDSAGVHILCKKNIPTRLSLCWFRHSKYFGYQSSPSRLQPFPIAGKPALTAPKNLLQLLAPLLLLANDGLWAQCDLTLSAGGRSDIPINFNGPRAAYKVKFPQVPQNKPSTCSCSAVPTHCNGWKPTYTSISTPAVPISWKYCSDLIVPFKMVGYCDWAMWRTDSNSLNEKQAKTAWNAQVNRAISTNQNRTSHCAG